MIVGNLILFSLFRRAEIDYPALGGVGVSGLWGWVKVTGSVLFNRILYRTATISHQGYGTG
jgi:hypothetical protein